MSTQAETWMRAKHLRGLGGPRQTWAQWCASCRGIASSRGLAVHPPEFAASGKNQEPWLTYWRDGLTASQAMERVAERAVVA